MTRIKICGVRDIDTARFTVECGTDFIGFVFAASRRQISQDVAKKISAVVHDLKCRVSTVGVFVNLPANEVNKVARECTLDYVQLSGDETWEYCQEIEKPIIKVIHVYDTTTPHEIVTEINKSHVLLAGKSFVYMLDSASPTGYGGTGKVFNWEKVKQIVATYPVMIAGGINAHNAAGLLKDIDPWGVDVSSGVEMNGLKNHGLIKEFIDTVRKIERKEKI